MFHRGKIWSEQPIPALNLACSSFFLWSTAILTRFRITRQNTLQGIDNKVIPRDLTETEISFFGIFIIKPFLLNWNVCNGCPILNVAFLKLKSFIVIRTRFLQKFVWVFTRVSSLILKKKLVDSLKCPVFMSAIPDTSQKVDCPPPKN